MVKKYRILAINPGSTSTKIAIFENEDKIFSINITHDSANLANFKGIIDQLDYRKEMIVDVLKKNNVALKSIDAFVGRGGSLYNVPSGTYEINERLLEDSRIGVDGQHAASLGALLANDLSTTNNKPSFIANPPCTDEMQTVARVSGLKNVKRCSRFHALNQKEVGRRYAVELGKRYEDLNLVIIHMGGGISVTAHRKGLAIDTCDCLCGDGPFSPNRCGGIPVEDIVKMCYSGDYNRKEMLSKINGKGGMMDHLGTDNLIEVNERIKNGDDYAKIVYEGLIYQIGKTIGSYATVLNGDVDAIILTGGIARDENLVKKITDMVKYIAQVKVYPGEFEMEALASCTLRVLQGVENAKEYTGKAVSDALI